MSNVIYGAGPSYAGGWTDISEIPLNDYQLWREIQENAEKTPSVKIALQNLINLHNLTKDHGDNET
jgi:hypothetical protein